MLRKTSPLVLLVAVTVLACWKVLFRDFTLLAGSDMARAYFPYFDVAAFWLKKGVLLLWDPHVFSGKPFMGEPQPGLFYPLNLLVMLVRTPGGGVSQTAMQGLLVLNYFLASGFVYLLARDLRLGPWAALLAGAGFAYGGFTSQLYGYVNKFSGFVWMPFTLLFFRRALREPARQARLRAACASAVGLSLAFLPGHHAPPILTGGLLLFYAAFSAFA